MKQKLYIQRQFYIRKHPKLLHRAHWANSTCIDKDGTHDDRAEFSRRGTTDKQHKAITTTTTAEEGRAVKRQSNCCQENEQYKTVKGGLSER